MRKKVLKIFGLISVLVLIGIAIMQMREKKDPTQELLLYGNVDIREVDLGFRVFGKVKSLFFEEGDRIQMGALLAELDPIPYEEKLAESLAEEVYAMALFSNAKEQLERRKKAILSSAISKEEFTNARASQEENFAVLERAKAATAFARTSLEDTKLIAPCNGILLARIREPGSVLNPGVPVYTVALDSPIWVRAYVSEIGLGKIFPGMKALVFTDTNPNNPYEGQIGFISPVAEFTPKNVETTDLRTELVYRLRVVIDNPNQGLRQGMPVTVKLKMD